MPKRLQRDWFHAYLLDPQKLRPGTRMPAAWLERQDRRCRTCSTARPSRRSRPSGSICRTAPGPSVPMGMGKQVDPAGAGQGRDHLPQLHPGCGHAGHRASAIPRRRNLAFDANDMRLALIWQGAFIDAGPALDRSRRRFRGAAGRQHPALPARRRLRRPGQGRRPPGRRLLRKELGYRFRGYRLTHGRSADVPLLLRRASRSRTSPTRWPARSRRCSGR